MASYAPMPYAPYNSPMAYSAPIPYAADSPPSYAPPSYDAPSSYGGYQSDSIPLTPLVAQEDLSGGGGGGGGMMTSLLALPPVILLPIALPLLLLFLKLGLGLGLGLGKPLPLPNVNITTTTPYYDEYYETTPYYDDSSYGNDYQNEINYNEMPPNDDNQYRKRRQAEEIKAISSSSTAFSSMSIAQVERLTQLIYAAINSQECIQRFLCEVGSLSRSFSDTTRTVTKVVEDYVPEKLKDSFNIFAKAEKCEQYKCGSL